MEKIGLFWGSDTGNTQTVAEMIAGVFGADQIDLYDIGQVDPETLEQYNVLILGIPTWGLGELQSDWDTFFPNLDQMDFGGKIVALFGLGDQYTYGDYFLDAMGMLYEKILERGASVIGAWSTEGYSYNTSKAEVGGLFVGLGIDADNQSDLTEQRVAEWVHQLKIQLAEIMEQA